MTKLTPCHLMAFRVAGSEDTVAECDTLLELTELRADGSVEIAFDIEGDGIKPSRVYVAFDLAALVRLATTKDASP